MSGMSVSPATCIVTQFSANSVNVDAFKTHSDMLQFFLFENSGPDVRGWGSEGHIARLKEYAKGLAELAQRLECEFTELDEEQTDE